MEADALELFGHRMAEIEKYGRSNDEVYSPANKELCIAKVADEGGEMNWYRAEYQQSLVDGRVQLGLVDFATIGTTDENNIRKIRQAHLHEVLSFVGKLRNEHISMDLLNVDMVRMSLPITAGKVKSVGGAHEIFLPEQYFTLEENLIEV